MTGPGDHGHRDVVGDAGQASDASSLEAGEAEADLPISDQGGDLEAGGDAERDAGPDDLDAESLVTYRVMIEVRVAIAAWSRTKAGTIRTTARLAQARWLPPAGFAGPSGSGGRTRWEIMTDGRGHREDGHNGDRQEDGAVAEDADDGGQRRPGDAGDRDDGAGVHDVGRGRARVSKVGVEQRVATPAGPPTTIRATTATGREWSAARPIARSSVSTPHPNMRAGGSRSDGRRRPASERGDEAPRVVDGEDPADLGGRWRRRE